MKKLSLAILAIITLTCATSSFASEKGWYLFGAGGQTTGNGYKPMLDDQLTFEGKNGFSSSLSTPVVYKLNVGYQINNKLALEGGFIGSTSVTYNASGGNLAGPVTAQARLSGWTFGAVGMMPLGNQFSLLGKLGVADIQVTAAVTGFGNNTYLSGIKSDITYGVGAKYDFTDTLSMRLDLDSYNVGSFTSSSRCSVWTVGVGFKY